MDKLKPCPFCGGDAIEREPNNRDPYWIIRCKKCSASIGGTHRRMNREAWNRRVNEIIINNGEITINL